MNIEITRRSPFKSINVPDETILHVEGEEALKKKLEGEKNKKNYLILFEIVNEDYENERTFEFFTGTRESLYWYLKDYMGTDNEAGVDIMKSKLIVEGGTFKFKNAPSIYTFMKDTLVRGIVDDPHPDIEEYHYEDNEEEEE